MNIRLVQLLFCLLCFSIQARAYNAEDKTFVRIDSRMGLSQNNVKCITQDSFGFMWFGTKNGLCRFDGRTARMVSVQDRHTGHANQNVSALWASSDGTLWVGTDRGVFRYDILSDSFMQVDVAASDGARMTNWVSNIIPDADGKSLWILLPEEGLFRVSTDGKRMSHYLGRSNRTKQTFSSICKSADGTLWVSGWSTGLYHFDARHDRFVMVNRDANGRSLMELQSNTLSACGDSLVIACQNGELFYYDCKRSLLHDNLLQDFSHTIVRNAFVRQRHVYVGTYDGLYDLDLSAGQSHHYAYDRNNPNSLSDDIVYTGYFDRMGGLWVGTMFGGVSYAAHEKSKFRTVTMDAAGRRFSSDRIREMVEDDEQRLWITTEDGGLNCYDLRSHDIRSNVGELGISGENFTTCIAYHSGNVLVGINKLGIKVIDVQTGVARMVRNAQLGLPETATPYSIRFDSLDRLWVGTDWGLYQSKQAETKDVWEILQRLSPVAGLENMWIYDLQQDRKGNVWVACMGSGLYRIDARTGKMHHFTNRADQSYSLSSDCVSSIYQDTKGRLWFSTDRGGICRYREKTDDFEHYSRKEGLPDDVAYAAVEDAMGNLWFGTNNGLVRFNPSSAEVHAFHLQQGLPGNQFNYKSAIACSDGLIYIGGIDGLVAFGATQGADASLAIRDVPFFFTRLLVDGQEVSPAEEHALLKQSILQTSDITLPSGSSNVALEVALLSFPLSKMVNYYYRLDPVDKTWTQSSDVALSFSNLAAGDYTLRVRASSLGVEDDYKEILLNIHVMPSPWLSWWAILLYVLTLTACLAIGFWHYKNRKEKQFMERKRLFEDEKEKEMNRSKLQFFTEITHEIRTPLTLINGPLEVISKKNIEDEQLCKQIAVMKQNTDRLLNLVSQLQDFQKLGAGELKLRLETVNLSALLRATIDRFEPTFTIRNKQLIIHTLQADIMAHIDREAITKVISNLLNNALKYGEKTCVVQLRKEAGNVILSVWSDGEAITDEHAQAIFDPFVQLDHHATHEGAGIGLALSRSLVAKHGGSLELVPSNERTGNEFQLKLVADEADMPPTQLHLENDVTLDDNLLSVTDDSVGASILLVEDEESVRTFTSEQLRERFVVETATNGAEALTMLHQNRYDLVVTDVMMPEMDGIELCRHIKQDIDLSHIPVIFLTAKNDLQSKLNGLRVGAEGYVEKPFSVEFLCQLAASILTNRQKEREAFAKRPFFPLKNMQMSNEDEQLMQKAMEVIEQHLSDESFNVDAMADAMCMSRSSLLRKIKKLFDMPPLDFIRLVRLKKAAELIRQGKYKIGEVSEMVGFSNHGYFSKLFARQFGVTPHEYENQVRSKKQ